MAKQRMYYPRTTYSQRRILFEAWEKTGVINTSCEAAHVSRSTFYHWKDRFEKNGYAGLKRSKKRGPAKGIRVSAEIQAKVEELKKKNPKWGKQRIADELCKENSWVPVVSANTVRRILQEKGLWEQVTEAAKKNVPTSHAHS